MLRKVPLIRPPLGSGKSGLNTEMVLLARWS